MEDLLGGPGDLAAENMALRRRIAALEAERDAARQPESPGATAEPGRLRLDYLTSALEAVDGRMWLVDRELRLIIGNSHFHRDVQSIIGRDLSRGESIWALPLPPEWRASWRASYERALAGEIFSVEREAGGLTIVYQFMPIRSAEGAIGGVAVCGLDITTRVQAEAARQETERKLGALFEILPVGISIVDAERNIAFTNAALRQILRLDQAGLTQGAYQQRQYLAADGSPMPADQFASARMFREQRPIAGVETGVVLETGELRWVSVSAVPVDLPDWRAVLVTADITERKRTERTLRISEERFAKAFQLMPAAQGITRLSDRHFIDVNDSFLDLLGYSRDEVIEHSVLDLGIFADLSAFAAISQETRQRGVVTNRDVTIRTKSGDMRDVIFSAVAIELDGETCFLTMMQDITERKRVEQELQAERAQLARRIEERTADLSIANAELARAARLKDEFLASMSHELRTPLNSILGRSEVLQEQVYGPLAPKQAELMHGIEESGRHLLALINDILDLSKIEAGKLDLQFGALNVDLLCRMCLRMVAQTAMQKRISVTSSVDSLVETIVADERRLKQILVNLLSNAVKFTPEGGSVALEVRGDIQRQTATFTVWDTGIGIAQEDLARLFKPFVQIDSSLSRQYNGTGLGLALVLRLAEAHAGSVALESAPGQGSRFSVTLPWNPAQRAPAPLPEPTTGGMPPQTPRQVLVIEDSRTAAEQVSRYLAELGANVEIHPQGGGAVERAIALQPDVIVLDILLPDLLGWDVLRQLKAEPRTQAIPVLIISVVDDPKRAGELGAAAFLLKPIDRTMLLATLRPMTPTPVESLQAALVIAPPEGAMRVLLAEDNQANIELLQDYLRLKGYDVVVARSGGEALVRAQEAPPNIILMDIQMPGMDGLEATRRIRGDAGLRNIPIIALTALAMPGDRERCLAAGADDYLAKPVNLQTLVATIDTLILRRKERLRDSSTNDSDPDHR